MSHHAQYFKRMRTTKRYFAHSDGATAVAVGDYVRLEGCPPISKNKRFNLAEVIRKST